MKKKRIKIQNSKIKITEWKRKPGVEPGFILIKNNNLEDHEKETIRHLASFGHDIEALAPSNMPGTNNPDLLMMGTFWEMKGPVGNNRETLEKRFRKAVHQAGGKAIFDLRNIKKEEDAIEVEGTIMEFLKVTRGMRRIILIKKDGKTLDIMK